jgi:hypothetical protein
MTQNNIDFHMVQCPHCNGEIIIGNQEINCGIFRHGVLKTNNQPIHPHLPKVHCDRLSERGLIYGCGKPFSVKKSDDQLVVEICDYI